MKARWYDPREGSWREIGEFASSGVHEFTPPTHGEKDDWVLVVDDAARNYPVALSKERERRPSRACGA